MDALQRARAAGARYLDDRGYALEAEAIRDSRGDDFAEVRIALQMHGQQDDRLRHLERALGAYAAVSFWIEDGSGVSDASCDGGSIARHALAGTVPPIRYHD